MGFINDTKHEELSSVDKEINALIKARGFEPGDYHFEPKEGLKRSPGSIINGFVKGKFSMETENADLVIFHRDDFSEKMWRKICAAFGFKYHVHSDIDKLTILPASIDVDVSIVTPIEEF